MKLVILWVVHSTSDNSSTKRQFNCSCYPWAKDTSQERVHAQFPLYYESLLGSPLYFNTSPSMCIPTSTVSFWPGWLFQWDALKMVGCTERSVSVLYPNVFPKWRKGKWPLFLTKSDVFAASQASRTVQRWFGFHLWRCYHLFQTATSRTPGSYRFKITNHF